MKKRALSLILALILALSLLPAAAMGEEAPLSKLEKIDTLMKRIAAGYTDSSDPWTVIDMAAYKVYAPDTVSVTGAAAKKTLIDKAITDAQAASPSDGSLAKDIVALQSAGTDPGVLYPLGAAVNLFDALDKLSPSSIYNVGYITLHAYRQSSVLTAEKADALFDVIDAFKNTDTGKGGAYIYDSWGYGADMDTPAAILASVAPFACAAADTYGVKQRAVTIRDDIIAEFASASRAASGSFGNANTDAMVIIGLAAAGIDPDTDPRFAAKGVSLLDGLMSYALADLSGFGYTDNGTKNAYSTEQGFRALIAAAQMKKNSGALGYACDLYDFSKNSVTAGYAAAWTGCPTTLVSVPGGAAVEVSRADGEISPVTPGMYDLAKGEYTYSAGLPGYQTKTGSFSISEADAANHSPKSIQISLASAPADTGTISVSVSVMTHPEGGADGQYTYKNNAPSYSNISGLPRTVSLQSGSSVLDALDTALGAANVSYTEKTVGYVSDINGISELAHGPYSGWMYMVNGTVPTVGCRDYKLKNADKVVWVYTDDYTREFGSEIWPDAGGDTGTEEKPAEPAQPEKPVSFSDVDSAAWYYGAVNAAAGKGLMTGLADNSFSPESPMTRAMLAEVLFRLTGSPESAGTLKYADADADAWYAPALVWAAENKIMDGVGGDKIAPESPVTRQQAAVMLKRFAAYKSYDVSAGKLTGFSDSGSAAPWAVDALEWACGRELMKGRAAGLLAPTDGMTRAECAQLLVRFHDTFIK